MDGDLRIPATQQTTATFINTELPKEKKRVKDKKQSKTENAAQTALNSSSNSASASTSSMQTRTVKVPARRTKPALTSQEASSSTESSQHFTENKSKLEISETKSSESIATGDELDDTVAVPESMSLSRLIEKLDSRNITLLKLNKDAFAEFSKGGYEIRFSFPKHPIQYLIIDLLSKTIDAGAIPDNSYVNVLRSERSEDNGTIYITANDKDVVSCRLVLHSHYSNPQEDAKASRDEVATDFSKKVDEAAAIQRAVNQRLAEEDRDRRYNENTAILKAAPSWQELEKELGFGKNWKEKSSL